MSRAVLAALEAARKGFLKLALVAPIQRGSVDMMLTFAAKAVENLAAALDAGDADELAEQVARVRQVAELWAGVVSALAAVDAAPVLCAPCAASQVAEPVTLPASAPAGDCARCGEALPATRPPCFCEGADAKSCSRAGWPADPCRCACHVPLPLPPAHALYAAERKALDDLCRWTEKRYGEDATVRDYQAAERKLAEAGGELIDARARAAEEPAPVDHREPCAVCRARPAAICDLCHTCEERQHLAGGKWDGATLERLNTTAPAPACADPECNLLTPHTVDHPLHVKRAAEEPAS